MIGKCNNWVTLNMVINSPSIYISWETLLNQSKLRLLRVGCSLIALRVKHLQTSFWWNLFIIFHHDICISNTTAFYLTPPIIYCIIIWVAELLTCKLFPSRLVPRLKSYRCVGYAAVFLTYRVPKRNKCSLGQWISFSIISLSAARVPRPRLGSAVVTYMNLR
jgi:hypothetical protein